MRAYAPDIDTIQPSFGSHDVRGVRAHVVGPAADAAEPMGASVHANSGGSVTIMRPVMTRSGAPFGSWAMSIEMTKAFRMPSELNDAGMQVGASTLPKVDAEDAGNGKGERESS